MRNDERTREPELQGRPAVVAITVVVLALLGGSWWGWAYAGPLGGLLGVLIGTAVGALAFTLIRAHANSQRFADQSAPDVRELPPDQAVLVLSAMLGANAGDGGSGGPALTGGLLGEIGKAKARAETDLDGALALLRGLAEDHPRSPAVPAAIVSVLADRPAHTDERRVAASTVMRLALTGGMNRLAAQTYAQLEVGEREGLELSPDQRALLGKALTAQGHAELAGDLASGQAR
jgi:hypothetical protein